MGAPFGSGLLYVKKDKISKLYPLLAAPDPESSDIRKFESLGTRSFPIEHAIAQALNFQLAIGTVRKQRRLQYLKEYWTSGIEAIPGISFGTNLQPANSCALCLMTVHNKKPEEISSALFHKYKIHTVAISWENISGVRITPNVYTVSRDLDRLITAITQLQAS
jgi:selenocysteine lyase/cysteine desulfurase